MKRKYELRLRRFLIDLHLEMWKKREESCFKCKDYLFVNLDLKLKKVMESYKNHFPRISIYIWLKAEF